MDNTKTTETRLQENVDSIAAELTRLVGNYSGDGDYTEEGQEAWFDYWSDILDISYLVTRDKSYKAVKVLVAFGGPNIWIDTESGYIEGYWWVDRARAELPRNVIEAIDNYFEESWTC